MDQTAPADQDFLRPQRELSEDTDLDHGECVCAGGIVRKQLGLEASLYQILQILSLTLFEKTPILQALQATDSQSDLYDSSNRLILFDF